MVVANESSSTSQSVVVVETDQSAASDRYRAGNVALFSSTKCPAGPGVSNSCELPFGFLWTPLAPHEGPQADVLCEVEEGLPPVLCLTCLAYLNLYAEFDLQTGVWSCPLCGAKNVAPPESLQPGKGALESLLVQPNIEFRQNLFQKESEQKKQDTCSIILVLDKNLPPAEAQAIGSTMQTILSEMAADVSCLLKVALIIFGKNVSIYQLGVMGLASADVFCHPDALTENMIMSRAYTHTVHPGDSLECIWRCLSAVYGITMQDENLVQNQPSRLERLRQRKEARIRRQHESTSDTRPTASTISARSPWSEAKNKSNSTQTQRCTGEAIQCAIELASVDMEKPSRSGRILLFTNGCPNYGEGSVVVTDRSKVEGRDNMRASPDIVDPTNLAKTVQYFKFVAKSAVEIGVALDVLCTGSSELAIPCYQALVEPSSGYVLPHPSFTAENLKCNIDFLLKQTFVSGLHFDVQESPGTTVPLHDEHWLEGCIIDVRMSNFLSPTHLVGPADMMDNAKCLLNNERSAFALGASLAAKRSMATNNLPSNDILNGTMTRVCMGRADPVATFSVMAQVNEFFQREPYAFFQCTVRYIDRSGKQLVTRVFTHRMSVSKQPGEWLDSVDDEVVPVLLAKEAVYRSVFGREMRAEGEEPETPDPDKLEDLAYDAQRDLDTTIHNISGAYRLLGLELGTTRSGMDLTEEGGVKAAGSSIDFAFPPELADALRRLYHFRRGPLLSPGPMQSNDDRAEIRLLFLRLPLEDCLSMMALSLWSTGPLSQPIDSGTQKISPVPPETLALWDNAILAGDHFFVTFVWSGRSTLTKDFDIVRERLNRFVIQRSQGRFPMPTMHVLSENDSMSRRFTALLSPAHGDPLEQQFANFPSLRTLAPEDLSALHSKFKFYDPSTDASFRNWFWSVASATSNCSEGGLSLCE